MPSIIFLTVIVLNLIFCWWFVNLFGNFFRDVYCSIHLEKLPTIHLEKLPTNSSFFDFILPIHSFFFLFTTFSSFFLSFFPFYFPFCPFSFSFLLFPPLQLKNLPKWLEKIPPLPGGNTELYTSLYLSKFPETYIFWFSWLKAASF